MSMPENDVGVSGAEIIFLFASSCNGNDAVKLDKFVVPESVLLPAMVWLPVVITNVDVPRTSGIKYVRLAAGVGALSVIVCPEPKVMWLLALVIARLLVNVSEANVGFDVVAISCGVERVMVPAPLVTITWFALT